MNQIDLIHQYTSGWPTFLRTGRKAAVLCDSNTAKDFVCLLTVAVIALDNEVPNLVLLD